MFNPLGLDEVSIAVLNNLASKADGFASWFDAISSPNKLDEILAIAGISPQAYAAMVYRIWLHRKEIENDYHLSAIGFIALGFAAAVYAIKVREAGK